MAGQTAEGVKAVVFDWAGTMVDFGSRAPMRVFVEAFAAFGIALTVKEVRGPMGLPKRDHIRALCGLPKVRDAWEGQRGAAITEQDIDAIYAVFLPKNIEVAGRHADLIPGARETVESLRARGIKVGSTTGYTREIMAAVTPVASAQGYAPDCLVCAGELPAGRPSPLMMYQCFIDLDVWPAAACVKVDDTVPGLAEGRNAGCWTVGVAVSGNAFGLSLEETRALVPDDFAARRARAVDVLTAGGAHYIIDDVGALPAVIDEIEARLARGEGPCNGRVGGS